MSTSRFHTDYLALATRIGEILVRTAFWHEDRCTWIGTVAADRRRRSESTFGTLTADLYGGTAGIAWFLGHLYLCTGDASFLRTASGALRQSLFASDRLPANRRWSFHTGLIGVAFVAAGFDTRLGIEEFKPAAVKSLRDLLKRRRRCSELDLIAGTAGAIAALPILGDWLGEESLISVAMDLGDRTVGCAERGAFGASWRSNGSRERNLTGFSHGAAGIAYALLELFAATGEARYRETAEAAFAYEQSCFDAQRENWPDFRGIKRADRRDSKFPFGTTWCHGAPGIALSRIRSWELLRDSRYTEQAAAAIRTTRSAVADALHTERGGVSLCHGLAGNTEILYEALTRDEFTGGGDVCALMHAAAQRCGARVLSGPGIRPALFVGLAGVGYFHLRLFDRDVPSVLMLRREDFL